MSPNVNFDNTKQAFAHKSDKALKRSYWLFKALNKTWLSQVGIKLAQAGLKIRFPLTPFIKPTVFRHFCGGTALSDVNDTVQLLAQHNIKTALDYAVEAQSYEKAFDHTIDEALQAIEQSRNDENISFITLKMTGVAPYTLLEKVTAQQDLTKQEQRSYQKVKNRLDRVGKAAKKAHVKVFIDAEETWIQDAIDELVTAMMEQYNQDEPLIYNTVQLYRKDRLSFFKESHKTAQEKGYWLAVKLVRGAYLEKERNQAEKQGYPSPIHETKADTDKAYDEALTYGIQHLSDLAFCAATHNESSCQHLIQQMEKKEIAPDHPRLSICQLYGMGDHITFNLAQAGYNVSKYVPYGPVKEVIPYLIRRAQENTSISGQMSRELRLLSKELERRKL